MTSRPTGYSPFETLSLSVTQIGIQEPQSNLAMQAPEQSHDAMSIVSDSESFSPYSDMDEPSVSNESAYTNESHSKLSRVKLAVVFVLSFITLIAPPVLVYIFTRQQEVRVFERSFHNLESSVYSSFQLKITRALLGLDSLSTAATSHVSNSKTEWPFVSIPDFNLRATNIIQQSDLILVAFSPFIGGDDREEWKNFSISNLDWIHGPTTRFEIQSNETVEGIFPDIFAFQSNADATLGIVPDTSSPPHLPSWNLYPLLETGTINFNILSVPNERESIEAMAKAQSYVFSTVSVIPPGVELFYTALIQLFFQDPNAVFQGEPTGNIFFPVFDTFDKTKRKIVGMTQASLYWPLLFRNLLPESPHDQIFFVVENTCEDVFTMRINGKKAIFEGYVDSSDRAFDNIANSFSLTELTTDANVSVPLNQDHCPYRFRLYPTIEMRDAYLSNLPIVFSACTAAFCLFVVLVVSTYGRVVSRRSKMIVKEALTNGKLAKSIFPENLRRRLQQIAQDDNEMQTASGNKTETATAKTRDFLGLLEKPVAGSFANCSIIFLCVDGFDSWSAVRTPEDIFKLLESLFGALDKSANRHSVFKVETIADSFVGATGLPDPQGDHALRMAKFARDAIYLSGKVQKRLSTALGPSVVSDLKLKAGIHSGPVTGGILGGEKSRFQIFGDTVNMASRMMTTGEAGKIQVSESSSQLLIQSWVVPRSDMVVVKGKTVPLSTHWLKLNAIEVSSTTGRSATSYDPSIGSE